MKEYNRAIDWIIYSFRLRNSMSKCRLIIDYIIACLEANSKAHNINVETSSNYLFIDFELSFSGELVLVFKASINNLKYKPYTQTPLLSPYRRSNSPDRASSQHHR